MTIDLLKSNIYSKSYYSTLHNNMIFLTIPTPKLGLISSHSPPHFMNPSLQDYPFTHPLTGLLNMHLRCHTLSFNFDSIIQIYTPLCHGRCYVFLFPTLWTSSQLLSHFVFFFLVSLRVQVTLNHDYVRCQ